MLTAAAALIAAAITFPADLRPDAAIAPADVEARESRGRAIVARGIEAQGGRAAWQATEALEAELTDTWDVTAFRLAMPMADDQTRLHATWTLHQWGQQSRYEVLDGAQAGSSLGLQQGQAWREGETASPDLFLGFFASTMQFLPTLAFRAEDAEVLRFVDTVVRDGRTYDRVLMTWGDPEQPSWDMDQYLLYYAQDNGRLHGVECTVRSFGPWMTGYIAYDGEIEAGGLTLPSSYDMGLGELGGPVVHRVRIDALSAHSPAATVVSAEPW